ncbi:hypothetical protein NUW54_g14099 [Trametes sanguinea]|uniref:Uncharacterized protein n=1 Tax=Trametes sanguinea TaxID=158606 RepID=A0ACC1MGW1_9APHY|nr:hypothetical protein NUW54_g14099 [Trametes sanguinea]
MAAHPSSSREGVDFMSRLGEHGERKVVALSGASCRLHPSRPLRVRLVLHPSSQPLPESPHQSSSEDVYTYGPDTDCGTITQSTLLHDVSFRLLVHATFMNMSSHTERVCTISIPLHILPPSAPLPEVESSIDEAYHKKHDKPPTRTVRQDDAEVPKLLLGLPPLDDTAEAGDREEDLDIPVSAMPIRMLVPGLADVLHALDEGLAHLRVRGELVDGHVEHIGGNCDDLIESSHDRVHRVIHQDTR